MKKTYAELLKDPRWQKKRLEIMEVHDFCCQECGRSDLTLHVHHTVYQKGANPWEYENKYLRCYCEHCHEKAEEIRQDLQRALGVLPIRGQRFVMGYILGLLLDIGRIKVLYEDVKADIDIGYGLKDYFRVDSLPDGQITLDHFKSDKSK